MKNEDMKWYQKRVMQWSTDLFYTKSYAKKLQKKKNLMGEHGLIMTAIIRNNFRVFPKPQPLLICVKTKALPTIFLKLIK